MRAAWLWLRREPAWVQVGIAIYAGLFAIGAGIWAKAVGEFLSRSPLF